MTAFHHALRGPALLCHAALLTMPLPVRAAAQSGIASAAARLHPEPGMETRRLHRIPDRVLLDVGYEIAEENAEPVATERDLRRAMDALPTVRPIDLVNLNRADPAFVRTVRANSIPLPIRHG